MNKIRVYELAQKMGVDNKEIMARLQAVGVTVKNHMAVIDEADAKKLQTPAAPTTTVKDVSKEEVRVSTGLIRRRAKVVEAVVEAPPVEVAPEPVKEEVVAVKPAAKPAPEPVEEPKVVETPAPAAPVEAEEVKPVAAPEKPEEKPAEEKPTATRAKILGRVEIVMPAGRGREVQPERREAGRPIPPARRPERPGGAPRAPEKPVVPAPAEMPAAADDRKKGRKGKEAPAVDNGKSAKKGGAPAGKKKEGFRKTEILEKRERIFEPGKGGKGKKKQGKVERAPEGKKTEITTPKAIKRIIKIAETITVGELAKRMGIKANDLIRALMKMGLMATINHPLDIDTAMLLAGEFGYEVENVAV
ncbi:MAG TPA: translation initiation factor IF-2 N-terminal domain-containing protein, partial [Geobacteraceae bacterium]